MKAVVTGRNYTSRLGMIRAAGIAGCEVAVIRTDPGTGADRETIDQHSRYISAYFCAPEPDEDRLVRVLLEKCAAGGDEKTVILPTDDYTAAAVDRHQDELKESFVFPHIGQEPGGVIRCMDKGFQKRLAEEAGLPVAGGWTARLGGDGFSIPDGIVFPCFVKPQVSFQGSKFYMKQCGSEDELKAHLRTVAEDLRKKDRRTDMLIEQFIPIDRELAVLGFADGTEVFIPDVITADKLHRGVTVTGTVRSMEDDPKLKEKLEKMIGSLGFCGLFDIDLYESGGKKYFNELNMRFGASGYAVTRSGVNLPGLLCARLLGREAPDGEPKRIESRTFASEKVCYQEYRDGAISWKEFGRILREADFTLLGDPEDTGPQKAFREFIRKYRIRRMIKKLLHRK